MDLGHSTHCNRFQVVCRCTAGWLRAWHRMFFIHLFYTQSTYQSSSGVTHNWDGVLYGFLIVVCALLKPAHDFFTFVQKNGKVVLFKTSPVNGELIWRWVGVCCFE